MQPATVGVVREVGLGQPVAMTAANAYNLRTWLESSHPLDKSKAIAILR